MRKIFVVGSLNIDMVMSVESFAKIGETVKGNGFFINCGGKGANQAAAIGKLGGRAVMLGCVGNDVFGKDLVRTLQNYQVDCRYVFEKEKPTGVAVIVVEGGDNRIILYDGANREAEFKDIDNILKLEGDAGDILLCQNEIPTQVTEETLISAKKLGMTTIYNPAPAAEISAETFKNIDYILPNESELASLTGTHEIEEGMRILRAKGIKNVIVTLGDKGSLLLSAEGLHRQPAVHVTAVDSTAAGDTFIGALAVMLSKDCGVKQSMEFATRCAAFTVQRKGAMQAIPFFHQVQ